MRKEYIAWFDVPNSGKLHGQSVMPREELIRCKDCKKMVDEGQFLYCLRWDEVTYDDEYCSRAERKEHAAD